MTKVKVSSNIVMFDPRLIALLAEVRNHPTLVKQIEEAELAGLNAHSIIFTFQKGDKDIPMIRTAEEGFGFIAAYAGIALEGDYVMEDIYGICDKVRERLEEKRAPNLYVNSSGVGSSSVPKASSPLLITGLPKETDENGKLIIPVGYKH